MLIKSYFIMLRIHILVCDTFDLLVHASDGFADTLDVLADSVDGPSQQRPRGYRKQDVPASFGNDAWRDEETYAPDLVGEYANCCWHYSHTKADRAPINQTEMNRSLVIRTFIVFYLCLGCSLLNVYRWIQSIIIKHTSKNEII